MSVPFKKPRGIQNGGKLHKPSGVVIWPTGSASVTVYYTGEYPMYRANGKNWMLHISVAELFVPNPENKPIVNHEDGNKHNPAATNLKWVTRSENGKHAYDNNLKLRDVAKLKPVNVYWIRRSKKTPRQLAEKYEVSVRTIYDVLSRRTWGHIH